jgi:hypothetical protein
MKTPRVRFRITAYHIVEASPGPWTGCHGRGGGSASPADTIPASSSCLRVATRPS